ncbi:hypothetical protein NE237_023136 [Protea cynaroides]|uniref:Uncharacterized protein n=1 Tax=Protea cynaroides TaxID=273540 RepID=A0A9Q0K550_9MAGN|nr:hypothetical protein NE237_023136 [Protea cynaroides]
MQEKKMKVKKGWLAVTVGLEDDEAGHQRFVIPISYLYHSLFKRLLEKAQEVYGYHTTGPLRLPCSVDDFLHLRQRIERETNNHQHLQLHGSYNLHHQGGYLEDHIKKSSSEREATIQDRHPLRRGNKRTLGLLMVATRLKCILDSRLLLHLLLQLPHKFLYKQNEEHRLQPSLREKKRVKEALRE